MTTNFKINLTTKNQNEIVNQLNWQIQIVDQCCAPISKITLSSNFQNVRENKNKTYSVVMKLKPISKIKLSTEIQNQIVDQFPKSNCQPISKSSWQPKFPDSITLCLNHYLFGSQSLTLFQTSLDQVDLSSIWPPNSRKKDETCFFFFCGKNFVSYASMHIFGLSTCMRDLCMQVQRVPSSNVQLFRLCAHIIQKKIVNFFCFQWKLKIFKELFEQKPKRRTKEFDKKLGTTLENLNAS